MAEWSDFGMRIGGSGFFLFLLPLICGFVYLTYRCTHPEVSRRQRALLVALRCAAVCLLLLYLVEPIFEVDRRRVVDPLFALLVDTSSSMATEEEDGRRLDKVKQVLEQDEWRSIAGEREGLVWGFAEAPYPLSLDTLNVAQAAGNATDLARALEESEKQSRRRRDLRGIILISDGIHNLGTDPVGVAQELEVPVYGLAVGRTSSPADIQIVGAAADEIGYVDRPLSVKAEVRAWGYAGRDVDMLLYEGDQLLARRRFTLGGDGQTGRVDFALSPKTPGPHIYRLAIEPEPGEFLRDNNETLVFARVLEERIQVVLLAGEPSPDLSFLQRSLVADSSLVLDTWVQKGRGRFYRDGFAADRVLKAEDLVILLDVGADLLQGEVGEAVQRRVRQGGGLLFIGGPRSFSEWDGGGPVADLLPVVIESGADRFVERETMLRISSEGRQHPVVRGQTGDGTDPWAQLPPLPGYFPIASRRQGAIALVEGAVDGAPPVFIAGVSGRGKVIAALSKAFWRLDLLSSGVGVQPQTIREFWRNAVKWLAIQTPVGRVRASTERQIYRAGEPVAFAAQVFDELLRPQEAATVQVELEKSGVEFQLLERGGGRYRGSWSGLEPGEYAYAVRAYMGDGMIGEDEGRFIVEQHSIESVDVRANPTLLEAIAQVSGGRVLPLEKWRELVDLLPMQKRLVEEGEELPLWGQNWSLVLVLVLLVAEWIVRKRLGMV